MKNELKQQEKVEDINLVTLMRKEVVIINKYEVSRHAMFRLEERFKLSGDQLNGMVFRPTHINTKGSIIHKCGEVYGIIRKNFWGKKRLITVLTEFQVHELVNWSGYKVIQKDNVVVCLHKE